MDVEIGRVKLTVVTGADKVGYGRVEVAVRDGQATATRRRNVIAGPVQVLSTERGASQRDYVLTMANGSQWVTQGCGCGG
jgi:hypothetical protein